MIGKLKGIIEQIEKDFLILDVMGVGYIVHVSASTLQRIGKIGDNLSLLIDMHVREDSINLYGFCSVDEQVWFRNLITIKGVGSRVALAILGGIGSEKLNQTIIARDKVLLTSVPGVGNKLAERIITELKDKTITSFDNVIEDKGSTKAESIILVDDAMSALSNLGYGRSEAYNAVNKVIKKAEGKAVSLGDLIRLSLKEIAK